MLKLFVITVCSFFLISSAVLARGDDRHDHSMHQKSKPMPKEIVTLKGNIHCKHASHTTRHNHRLEFVNQENGEEFDLESSELSDLHCKSGKNYRVEVEAEKSDGILFWNGDLKVKSYKILTELGDEQYVHTPPKQAISGSRLRR